MDSSRVRQGLCALAAVLAWAACGATAFSVTPYLSYFEVEPNGVDFSDVDARDRSQLFHRVDYGPVTLIFLDTNNGDDYDLEKDTNIWLFRDANCPSNRWDLPSARSPDFNPGSRQYTWLTKNLREGPPRFHITVR